MERDSSVLVSLLNAENGLKSTSSEGGLSVGVIPASSSRSGRNDERVTAVGAKVGEPEGDRSGVHGIDWGCSSQWVCLEAREKSIGGRSLLRSNASAGGPPTRRTTAAAAAAMSFLRLTGSSRRRLAVGSRMAVSTRLDF